MMARPIGVRAVATMTASCIFGRLLGVVPCAAATREPDARANGNDREIARGPRSRCGQAGALR